MRRNTIFGKAGLTIASLLVLAACGSAASESGSNDEGVETITFINHKTDWEENGKWDEYMAAFNEKYPDIKVEIETMTDYAGQMNWGIRRS